MRRRHASTRCDYEADAVLLATGPWLIASDLPETLFQPHAPVSHSSPKPTADIQPVTANNTSVSDALGNNASEKLRLLHILTSTRWNKTRAAQEMGISRQTLYRKIRLHGLDGQL